MIELGHAGLRQRVTSTYALEEARRNLALKFPDGLERLGALSNGLRLATGIPGAECPAGLPDKGLSHSSRRTRLPGGRTAHW